MGTHFHPTVLPQADPRVPGHLPGHWWGPVAEDPPPSLWAELWRSNNNPPSGWLVITDGICMETGCFYSLRLHLLLLKSPLCT